MKTVQTLFLKVSARCIPASHAF